MDVFDLYFASFWTIIVPFLVGVVVGMVAMTVAFYLCSAGVDEPEFPGQERR